MVSRAVSWALGGAAFAGALASCTPTFTDDTSKVTAPRLLAVQTTPAEAAPGKAFTMTALYVGPEGVADPSSIDWAICLLQNPLGDPDPIAPACFVDTSSSLTQLGSGGSVPATVPSNACQLFGPDSPPPSPGQPAARPTDPDATGGFYLPVRLRSAGDEWSAALQRIVCQPSGVTESVSNAFSTGYVLNENPAVSSLALVKADGRTTTIPPDAPSAEPGITVSTGVATTLQVGWPGCPATVGACNGAETYVYIDPTSKQIATGRESIVASWYATGGSFDLDRVGRSGTDTATTAENHWTAPTSAGVVHLWVVLLDARGGVGWGSYAIKVE
jgi:hypothetical protein